MKLDFDYGINGKADLIQARGAQVEQHRSIVVDNCVCLLFFTAPLVLTELGLTGILFQGW